MPKLRYLGTAAGGVADVAQMSGQPKACDVGHRPRPGGAGGSDRVRYGARLWVEGQEQDVSQAESERLLSKGTFELISPPKKTTTGRKSHGKR